MSSLITVMLRWSLRLMHDFALPALRPSSCLSSFACCFSVSSIFSPPVAARRAASPQEWPKAVFHHPSPVVDPYRSAL
ncbi:hypothetical protein [Sphingopyxis sp. BSNA05]|uniref:hypothetical protein n=1 Tax=Sphingopyxis sp. BSNA05 TaxID=1236614 RepID=UPI0015630913|nr:hypothetical protein [Sphingopyxis sp. BSNA05]